MCWSIGIQVIPSDLSLMTDDAQPKENTAEAVDVSEDPQSTATVQLEHPRPQTQPIPGPALTDDSGSRHVNTNAHQQSSQPQTQTQQHLVYAPTPHAPRRASYHDPRRRSFSPRLFDEYPSLALSGAEDLGRIPSSAHSLPPPRSHSREPAHAKDSQAQRPHSFDGVRHSIPVPDTMSWIVPEEKCQVWTDGWIPFSSSLC
jgi:hypothetical protein